MTPPVSAWRDDRTASRRVNESKLSRPSCGSSGRLLTGVRANRYWKYLTEEEFVLLQRARDREPGLELVDEGESFAEAGHEVAWLEDPLVGPALGADLRDARRKASVLRRERVGQDFYRLDGAARQLEIEVASRRVVEAGAAHLQRPGGRRATLDAQAALGPADDARQHGQQRLKSSPESGWMSILAPVSTSLTATGCRLSVGELPGATTSTLSRTKVNRISTSTC